MLIVTIRSDNPEAEVGLYDDDQKIDYVTWTAHRQLAETLHGKIRGILKANGYALNDIEAVAYYEGPGSFTGLRIGLTVANALAYALEVPIVGSTADTWIEDAVRRLEKGENQIIGIPEYGAEAHITLPRK